MGSCSENTAMTCWYLLIRGPLFLAKSQSIYFWLLRTHNILVLKYLGSSAKCCLKYQLMVFLKPDCSKLSYCVFGAKELSVLF